MCFQRKTIINQTGLGDEQYQDLQGGQQGLGSQIEEGFVSTGGKLDTLSGDVAGINTNTNTGFTNLTNTLGAYGDLLSSGQTDAAAGRKTYYDNMLTALQNNTGGLQTTLDTGFNDVGGRFNTVDQANADIQTSVNTGFSDTATANQNIQNAVDTGFADTQGAMTNNTRDIRDDITSNFDATNQSLSDAQTNIRGDITASQSEVLGGQGGLASSLNDLSNTNDTYFGSLSAGQENLEAGLGGFRTTFDNYVDRYSDDTTLANQTRADLQQAQATGFDTTRQSIGTLGNTVTQGQRDIQKGTDQLADTVQGGFQQTQQASAGIMANQDDLATGQRSLAQTFMTESGEIDTALLNQTRDLARVASTQTDLDLDIRQNFLELSNAFDDQGMLIENSVDQNGNTIRRQLDDNGMLMLRAMSSQGDDLGSKVIDVNDSVRRLQSLTRQQGASMQMGTLSPASQTSETLSGFASPFTTTR